MNLTLNMHIMMVVAAMLAFFQIPALILTWYFGEDVSPFLITFVITVAIASLTYLFQRNPVLDMQARDGVVAVILGWVVMIVLGALPYFLSGSMNRVDALFESASGFTTTGSTVLADIESLPQGILFWRSMSQWIGGMGILVLVVAVLPHLGVGGAQIMKAEMPGFKKDKLAPRVADTARILWEIYIGMTLLCFISYWLVGMSALDALHHAFTTVAIGGFSPRNTSLADYAPAVQWCVMVFMIAAGINYVLYYRLIFKREWDPLRDEELKWYLLLMFGVGAFCSLVAYASTAGESLGTAIRHGFFQSISLVTNTGYANVDWESWPLFVQIILLTIAIPGAMTGSTTGGIKMIRAVVLFKVLSVVINRMLTPERVLLVKINGKKIPRDLLDGVMAMGFAITLVMALSTISLVSMGMDLPSAYSAALTTLINVGPGIGWVGPMDNFSTVPDPGKLLLVGLMVTGRLEIFTVLILFVPHFWKPDFILATTARRVVRRPIK